MIGNKVDVIMEDADMAIESEELESDESIHDDIPFEPTKLQIVSKVMLLDLLMRRIKSEALELQPDFQRGMGVWSPLKQSRLIESLLMKIPIPSFYFDASNEDRWLVVDGLQRLSTIRNFIDGKFVLENLEFLHEFEGLTFSELTPTMQRRIEETEFVCYQIMPNTPSRVKFEIFRRINTGGNNLTAQEMRHALYVGAVTDLLKDMVSSREFLEATSSGIPSQRMADRECALRYLAFSSIDPATYAKKDLDLFLCDFMKSFNDSCKANPDGIRVARELALFKKVMLVAFQLFGKVAFRKAVRVEGGRTPPISKALFEAWSVNLAKLNDSERADLIARREDLSVRFERLMRTDELFMQSITHSTGHVTNVRRRFDSIRKIIRETLDVTSS